MTTEDLSPGARRALAAVLGLAGMAAFAMGCITALRGAPFSDDRWMGLPLGVAIVSFSALLLIPAGAARARALVAAVLVTGFALAFDWIAFGPGERQFTASAGGSAASVRSAVSPGLGRTAFGIVAVLMDAGALLLWIGAIRRSPVKIDD